VNEAVARLREGVMTDLDSIDAGLVYGTGFTPYLGGPMRYMETLGEAATAPSLARGPRLDPIGDVGICSTLRRLAQEYGTRFEPDAGWTQREIFTHQLLPKV
ncbi:MAG: hypothetical protein AABZ50_00475, partial [Pseudomonadota bacterium]